MKYRIIDKKYHFYSIFDTETGAYLRTGILDKNGKDTGKDPFMGSFPNLIDVGVMGHCIHGKTGLCVKAGIGCYYSDQIDFSFQSHHIHARFPGQFFHIVGKSLEVKDQQMVFSDVFV